MANKRSSRTHGQLETVDFRHTDEKRKNIPPAKIAAEGKVPRVPKAKYHYSPHLPPVLRFDPTGAPDKLPELLAEAQRRPLKPEEAKLLAAALRKQEPWLEWATKREQHEKGFFEVDPVALHIHERVSAQAIVRIAMREDVQRDLFADPQQPHQQAVQFYKHDMDWANRLILGDSLQVMSSLAKRENLAGKVQMIYMDPPYGIKFASNFQSEVGRRDVKDRDEDLSREPEMVRAYRDTWTLGVHSYLSYLRDRFIAARTLLLETGSIFVQIGDENLHLVRTLLDEVFGRKNFQSVITFRTSVPLKSVGLPGITDYVLWYSKDADQMKRFDLFTDREYGAGGIYTNVEEPTGHRRTMTAAEREAPETAAIRGRIYGTDNLVSTGYTSTCIFDVNYEGISYAPASGKSWKTNPEGMRRLLAARRVNASGKTLRAMMYIDDYPVQKLTNLWTDVKGESDKQYVVQTSQKVVQRCMLMTTEPGDLVLDPTCGGGTTAFVAEAWGRRWITMDTSRVALTVARARLISGLYENYRIKGDGARPSNGFSYRTVPHVTLKSVAQNPALDPLFEKHDAILDDKLASCQEALAKVSANLRTKLLQKLKDRQREVGKRGVTEADERRWNLPSEQFVPWNVPFDVDPDWPTSLRAAVSEYRTAWQTRMSEINEAVARNAEQEDLVDQPEVENGVVRVTGPFTVEGVRPEELSLGDGGLFDPTPNEFEPANAPALENLNAYLSRMVQLIRQDGVTFLGNKHRKFSRVEPLFESSTGSLLHAEGAWANAASDADTNRVAIAFGPQYGPVTALQVEEVIRSAKRYDELVIAGFSFDAEATAVIQESSHPKLVIHQAFIRPDVNPGMDGLLKDTPNSQLFTVFGQPDVKVKKVKGGDYEVELKGVDIYDPIQNTLRSSGADKVAAWFLDGDFDGRCFCITQAFFPDKSAWEKIAKALKGSANEEAFEKLSGTVSLPFPAGKHRRIAVKVIDPRGNEVMAIHSLPG